mgnify:CR=1 FL=1
MAEKKAALRARTKLAVQREIARELKGIFDEAVEIDGSIPGAKLDRHLPTARKVPFTYRYFAELFGEEEFDPEETVPVTINGITVLFEAGKTIKAPQNFIGEYKQWRARLRKQSKPIVTPEGVVMVNPGAGPLLPYGEETEGE